MERFVLNLIPSLAMLGIAWWSRLVFRSWLAPSALFNAYWGLILLATLATPLRVQLWPGASWLICLFGYAYSIGGLLVGASLKPGEGNRRREERVRARFRRSLLFLYGDRVVIGCAVLGMLSVFVLLASAGTSWLSLFRPKDLATIAHQLSVARYAGFYIMPLPVRALTTFIYLGTFVGGAWMALVGLVEPRSRHRKRWIALLPIVPAVLQGTVLTTRASILLSCLFFLSAYLAVRIAYTGGAPLKHRVRSLVRFALLGAGIFSLFVGLQVLRIGKGLSGLQLALLKAVSATPMAALVAFSEWLKRTLWTWESVSGGRYTLAGVFDLLGLGAREMGLYTDQVTLPVTNLSTNVYTVFRGFILDFSLLGAVFLAFVGGMLASVCLVYARRGSLVACSILALTFTFTFWSHVVSVLNYNTINLAWFAFLLLSAVSPRTGTKAGLVQFSRRLEGA